MNSPYRPCIPKVIPLKIFLDVIPSSSVDVTCALRVGFRGGSVSFRFKGKENFQRCGICGDVFFDILITGRVASALPMFQYISKL